MRRAAAYAAARARRRHAHARRARCLRRICQGLGAKGLAWIKVNQRAKGAEGLQSPIVKNLHARALAAILERTAAQDGDVILFGADESDAGRLHGRAAPEGRPRPRPRRKSWRPLWVVDFPMFEPTRDSGRRATIPSPPEGRHEQHIESAPGKAYAKAYEWC